MHVEFCQIMHCISGFPNIEPTLLSLDKSHLAMVYYFLDMVLDFVQYYFI